MMEIPTVVNAVVFMNDRLLVLFLFMVLFLKFNDLVLTLIRLSYFITLFIVHFGLKKSKIIFGIICSDAKEFCLLTPGFVVILIMLVSDVISTNFLLMV